jgi:hypothetical protein
MNEQEMISFPAASELLAAKMRTRQCRVPTMLFWVGTRHCRLLYIIRSVTGIDMKDKIA